MTQILNVKQVCGPKINSTWAQQQASSLVELGLSSHRREARLHLCASGTPRLGLGVRVICSENELEITPSPLSDVIYYLLTAYSVKFLAKPHGAGFFSKKRKWVGRMVCSFLFVCLILSLSVSF